MWIERSANALLRHARAALGLLALGALFDREAISGAVLIVQFSVWTFPGGEGKGEGGGKLEVRENFFFLSFSLTVRGR